MRGHCKEKLRQNSIIKTNVPAVTVDEGVSKMMCQLLKQQSAPDIDIIRIIAVYRKEIKH